jgi:hypothetical protein
MKKSGAADKPVSFSQVFSGFSQVFSGANGRSVNGCRYK